VEEITRQIVPDDWARAIHQFEAVEFRHFLQTVRMADPVIPGERDEAYSRLNLGWRVRKRSEGALLRGENTCCEYLNRLVDAVWADMRLRAASFVTDFAGLCRLEGFERMASDTVRRILDMFTLRTRAEWPAAPPGFSPHDWYPWRFRRRLSVISRPILQFNATGDARYLIVPGMVRDGFRKVLDYCYDGGYDARKFPAGRMRSWVGATENKRGHRFNLDVAERLSELGWQARANVALTEILNAKLPRNYGDIDVLAWRDGRVLAIECKDLELAMTIGEIARQLYEFRGGIVDGRPDRLKRHLLRTEVLKVRASEVGRFVGFASATKVEAWLIFSDVVPISFSEISQQHPIRQTTVERLSEVQTPAVEA
jgi:Holliday junction resolvase